MRFFRTLTLLTALAAMPASAQIAPPVATTPPRSYNVAGNIFVAVQEDRNSTVIVGEDSLLVVETNYRERTDALKTLLATISPKPVKIAINSHWHADHVGGNAALAAVGAVTIAQEKTRVRMGQAQVNRLTGNVQQPAFPSEFWPMVTFRDSLKVHFGGHDLEMTYHPDGHTDSDVVLRIPDANIIYVGGLMNYPTYAGVRSATAFVDALDKILAQANDTTKIIPWRGPVVGKAELAEWRNILATVRDRVQTGIREGKTVDQIVATNPSREFDAKWSPGAQPANFVRQIYAGLTQPLD